MKFKTTLISHCFYLPKLEKINTVIKSFSLTEKIIFWFFTVVFILSTLLMLNQINKHFLIKIPTQGGEIAEGIIGTPRFINPLLAISNADRDLTELVYSGLLKATPEGKLIPDLAKNYIVSKDGLIYTFNLKDNIFFQDGIPITTADVNFTIKTTLNNTIKSPKRANWEGVTVKVINKKQIEFILKKPYSPFPENLTLGILPKHIWETVEPEQFAFSQFNIKPIGSGPYEITNTSKNSSGIMEKYELEPFDKYALGKPYISKIIIKFYPNEKSLLAAYNRGEVEDINSISPDVAKKLKENGHKIEKIPLPRIFGVFFNQNQNSIFTHIEIRKALDEAVNRKKIVQDVLSGYGTPIYGPVPTTSQYYYQNGRDNGKYFNPQKAIDLLEKNGWKINKKTNIREKIIKKVAIPLKFTITTSDAPELKAVANMIKNDWEKIGAKVTIKIFEVGDLNQNVIRPRKYDALLFGEIIGRDMDLFAFWHSSQRNDPGLNIASYANINADRLLEQARTVKNEEKRKAKYIKFQKEILSDTPASFIYSPDFIYIIPDKIKGINLKQLTLPSERFLNIQKWFIKTETIWKIFAK